MSYETHGTGEKDDSFMGVMKADETRTVDYLAVTTFVFMLLDSGLSVSDLTTVLDQVAELNPEKDTAIACTNLGRARMAVGLVNAFLLKDSFQRGHSDM